jgi:hypothetical protein
MAFCISYYGFPLVLFVTVLFVLGGHRGVQEGLSVAHLKVLVASRRRGMITTLPDLDSICHAHDTAQLL